MSTKTHHTSYKGNTCPRPGATPIYVHLDQPGWATPTSELTEGQQRFNGYYLHGDDVLLNYVVAGRAVQELHGADENFLFRDVEISGGE